MINDPVVDAYRNLAEAFETIAQAWQMLASVTAEERDYWKEKAEFLELVARKA